MNKKGFVKDYILFVVLMFVIGVSVVVSYLALTTMNQGIAQTPSLPAAANASMVSLESRFDNVWDYMFLTLLVGGIIGMMVLSGFLRSNPAVFWVVVVAMAIVTIAFGYLANAFETMMATTALTTVSQNFPITTFVLNNFLLFGIGTLLIMALVFFARPEGGVQ